MTVAELFERAKIEAPGIAEEDFLSQLIAHLQSGRIVASAYDCEIEQGLHGDLGAWRYVPRAADMRRQDIPVVEWAELAIHMDSATAQKWGHDRSPKWTRDGGDGDPVWGDGYFDGADVYTDLLLTDQQGTFKRLFTSQCGGESAVADDVSGLNDRKRKAVEAAFDKHGIETLRNMLQSKREELVIKTVRDEWRLPVSDRYVRAQFRKALDRRG